MRNRIISKISITIIVMGLLLVLIFIGVFMAKFAGQPISDQIESWAQFGDYIGGILNPILALINICVFVILTITIQNITDKNNNESLETNKKIALMSMKHEELKHFKEIMDKNLEQWRKDLESIQKIKQILYGYNVLEYRMIFLFPELKESENNAMLRKYIVEALKNHENGRIKEAAHCHIPVSNTYGMLVSDLGEWTVK
jgi:uncharacterized membrane protein